MAWDCKIKGEPDPIRIEDHQVGRELQNYWLEYKGGKANNGIVKVAHWTGSVSDIQSFRELSTVSQAMKPQMEYKDLTPEQIAKNRIILQKMKETVKTFNDKSRFLKNLNG